MFKLEQTIEWCERRWKVAAILWLGERYYMLTRAQIRPSADTVSLVPEVVLQRSGAKVWTPPKRKARLTVVKGGAE